MTTPLARFRKTTAAPGAGGRSSSRARQDRVKWLYLAPALIVVAILVAAPLLLGLGASFTNWHLFARRAVEFIGLDNWIDLFSSNAIDTALNTLVFVLLSVPISILVSFVVSLALTNITRGKIIFQTLFLIPLVVSPIAVSIIGRMMLNAQTGPVNAFIELFGVDAPAFLTERWPATFAIVAIDVWVSSAFLILLFSAGLSSLPDEIYEAAEVDGATYWQSMKRLTLPLMLPVILIATVLKSIVTFHIADIPLALTGGGPGNTTEPLSLTVYNTGVPGGAMATAATQSYFLLIMMAVFVLILMAIFRPFTKRWST